jgi:hypothetical protein
VKSPHWAMLGRGALGSLYSSTKRNFSQMLPLNQSSLAEYHSLKMQRWVHIHTYQGEGGPEHPKESGPRVEDGGEILEGMYTRGCTLADSKISGRAGGQDSVSVVWQGRAGIVSNDRGPHHRDYLLFSKS